MVPTIAPGIDRQTNFWRCGGLLEYDWRDRPNGATSGGKYSAQYVRYLARDLSPYSFFRLDLDAVQYIPLFNRTRVIALHGASSLSDTRNSQQVPFYLQPTLGGPDTLRGFRYGRFYGNNSALVSAEYRWFCSPVVELAAFADGGKVFQSLGAVELPRPPNRCGLQRTCQGQDRKKRVQFGYRLQPRGISDMVSRKQFDTLVWPAALGVVAIVFVATPGAGASGTVPTMP